MEFCKHQFCHYYKYPTMTPIPFFKTLLSLLIWSLLCGNQVQAQVISKVEPALPNHLNAATVTNSYTLKVTVSDEIPVPGEADLVLELENGPTVRLGQTSKVNVGKDPITFSGKFTALPDHFSGNARLVVTYRVASNGQGLVIPSAPFPIHIDRVPPRIVSVRPIEDSYGARALVMSLSEENPAAGYPAELFSVKSVPDSENLLEIPTGGQFAVVNGEITIVLKRTVNTLLSVEVKDGKDKNGETILFQDRLKNTMAPFATTLAVTGQRPSGPAVEYPPFVVPADAGRHSDNNKVRPSGGWSRES
jgi:hypothetical protein